MTKNAVLQHKDKGSFVVSFASILLAVWGNIDPLHHARNTIGGKTAQTIKIFEAIV